MKLKNPIGSLRDTEDVVGYMRGLRDLAVNMTDKAGITMDNEAANQKQIECGICHYLDIIAVGMITIVENLPEKKS